MKHLLFGLTLLASLASYAGTDCKVNTINIAGSDLSADAIETLSEKYILTSEKSPLVLQIGGQCQGSQCSMMVAVMNERDDGSRSATGNSAVGYGSDDWFGNGTADDRAVEDAISKLNSCI